MSQAAQHSQRATELNGLLNVVKTRVQDLEDRCLSKAVQQQSHNQRLQQEKQEAQVWQQTPSTRCCWVTCAALTANSHEQSKKFNISQKKKRNLLSEKIMCSRNDVKFWSRGSLNRRRRQLSSRGNCISPSKKKSSGWPDRIRFFRTSATKLAGRTTLQINSKPL